MAREKSCKSAESEQVVFSLGQTDRKSRCYGGDTGFGLLLTGALLAAETCEQRLFVIFGVWLGRLDPNLLQ